MELSAVRVVEPLSEYALDSRPHSFQLGYGEYTLYVSASSEIERDEWLRALRERESRAGDSGPLEVLPTGRES